jgi:hypothetical protein
MEDFSAVRRQYAELIRQRADLRSERLVKALSEVPREDYLGPGPSPDESCLLHGDGYCFSRLDPR